jgi:hypothetical protein
MKTVNANIYTGSYGPDSIEANIIAIKIEARNSPLSSKHKKLIFVIDVSGSMSASIPLLKASLLATRDLLLGLTPEEVSKLSPAERDLRLRQTIPLVLITFSETAKTIWDSSLTSPRTTGNDENTLTADDDQGSSFEEAVNAIAAETRTNMGAGIEMAYQQIKDEIAWIVVLTDGVSNVGVYQRASSFALLAEHRPKHSKIIPLGYGTSFDVETLNKIGNYTYVNDSEIISSVFGSLISEVMTAYGVDGKITLPSLPPPAVIDDEIIRPAPIEDNSRIIVGTPNFGTLFSERSFILAYLPFGDRDCPRIMQYQGLEVKISYFDIDSMSEIEIQKPLIIQNPRFWTENDVLRNPSADGNLPEELSKAYFDASKGRLMMSFYAHLKNRVDLDRFVITLKKKLASWNHPLAQEAKEEILRTVEDAEKAENSEQLRFSISNLSTDTICQTSYRTRQYQTPSQLAYASANLTNTGFYIRPTANSVGRLNT